MQAIRLYYLCLQMILKYIVMVFLNDVCVSMQINEFEWINWINLNNKYTPTIKLSYNLCASKLIDIVEFYTLMLLFILQLMRIKVNRYCGILYLDVIVYLTTYAHQS